MVRTYRLFAAAAVLATLPFAGCRSPADAPASPRSAAVPAEGGRVLSLYEQRLLRTIEDMEALDARAADASEEDYPEIERGFHNVATSFNSIIADNPDQLEVRLIYAKFLDRFGDRIGARDQCAEVLRRDPGVAVAHQMLGTFFAEEGDFGRALAYYLQAVQFAPDEPVYHYGLGDLLFTYEPGFIEEGVFNRQVLQAKMLDAFREAAVLAPESLPYQFRYGEAFYDLAAPDWEAALAHWGSLTGREDLTPLQAEAVRLHRARCLGELGRYDEARRLAAAVTSEGLRPSRDALLAALEEAAARS